MNTKEEIKNHRLPCGAATVSIESVCRRRLRDHFDAMLDRLTEETHPEGRDPEEEDLNDVELPTEEPEETEQEKKKRTEKILYASGIIVVLGVLIYVIAKKS